MRGTGATRRRHWRTGRQGTTCQRCRVSLWNRGGRKWDGAVNVAVAGGGNKLGGKGWRMSGGGHGDGGSGEQMETGG